ncbi:hypothetical protein G6035_11590 [Arthrobacter sp. SDTb3-6]|nr:hypothetical protein [Arthrobacter sp. SDTb3-6]
MVAMLVMVALVVDVGMVYSEKGQLQNAADSAALAVAGECSKNPPPCAASTWQTTANTLANQNSSDGQSTVEIEIADSVVTATTSTLNNGGDSLSLPFGSWTGLSSAKVEAVAQAAWGGIFSGPPTLPLTFGNCELNPDKYPLDGPDRTILLHSKSKCSGITSSGINMPGGFGWLATNGTCNLIISVDQWAANDPGGNNPCPDLFTPSLVGQTALVPIFGDVTGTGAGAQYKIVGWGVFLVKGWSFGAGLVVNWPACVNPDKAAGLCSPSDTGLYGHFVKQLTYEEGLTYGGTTEYGATAVHLIK